MPAYPLSPENFEQACKDVKLVPDKALMKLLGDYFKIDNVEHPEQRLALLPKILKLATDFKKSKEVAAAGPKGAKAVAELIDFIPEERKQLEKTIEAFRKKGAQEVGVLFRITDWKGKPFAGVRATATFDCPGTPTITRGGDTTTSGFKVGSVKLEVGKGTVGLEVISDGLVISGSGDFVVKPGGGDLRFNAVQHSTKIKHNAKSLDEMKRKFGLKGTAGINWSVISVGGEMSKDTEDNQAHEEAVEYVVELANDSFDEIKQT